MKQYKIFEHPRGEIEAVKQGWSWPGFFLNIIWAFFKQMWMLGIGLLAIFFFFGLIGGVFLTDKNIEAITFLGNLIIVIVFGIKGNEWREKSLISQGFINKEIVTAENSEWALHAFKEGHKHNNQPELVSEKAYQDEPVISLTKVIDEPNILLTNVIENSPVQTKGIIMKNFSGDIQEINENELSNETKSCPNCHESIKLLARKCRYCQTLIDQSQVDRDIRLRKIDLLERKYNISLKDETKRCPACAELINIKSMVCEFCKEAFNVEEVEEKIKSRLLEKESTLWRAEANSILRRIELQEQESKISLKDEQKPCPACGKLISINTMKCVFCGKIFDPFKVEVTAKERISELREKYAGKTQCPVCARWDVHRAYVEDGSMGLWCPHCKKSVKT